MCYTSELPVTAKTENVQAKGASPAGFHFYNLYLCCPYKFYLRNVRGLDTDSKSPALIRGDAVHQGLELFYKTGNLADALSLTKQVVEVEDGNFDDDETARKTATTALAMVESWALTYGEADFTTYEEFALEQELEIPLIDRHGDDTGLRVTMRIDRLARTSEGKWHLCDVKTSTFSKQLTENAFALSDQPTLYIAACKKSLGIDIEALFCDIAYAHPRAKKPEPLRAHIPLKSDLEIEQTLESVLETFLTINEKVDRVVEKQQKPHEAFPRNTYYCMAYNKPCEFASICRLSNGIDEDIPLKAGLKQGKKLRALGSYTTDRIGEDK